MRRRCRRRRPRSRRTRSTPQSGPHAWSSRRWRHRRGRRRPATGSRPGRVRPRRPRPHDPAPAAAGCRRTRDARPRCRRRRPDLRQGRWRSGGHGGRSPSALPGRDRRRTSRRSRPAGPARCRCCSSPCRGGCAARGSAGQAGTPGCRRRPWTPRPAGRACCAPSRCAPPGSRRADRRSRAAHRNAGVVPTAMSAPMLPRRLQQGQREQVGGHGDDRAPVVRCLDQRGPVVDLAGRPGVLHEHAEHVAVGQAVGVQVGDDDADAERLGPRLHHCDGLRKAARRRSRTPRRSPPCWCVARRVIASAAAVASSSSEAPDTGSPVRSLTAVWKLSSASSRPWEISGWYGV